MCHGRGRKKKGKKPIKGKKKRGHFQEGKFFA